MVSWITQFEGLMTEDEVLNEFRHDKFFPLLEGKPEATFVPKKKRELLSLIKFASKEKIPLVPVSSEWDFHGSSLALNGGIVIDLRKLKQIEKIRECFDGMSADVEPGVTFRELNEKLSSSDLRAMLPLRMPADASVLSTYYGKNPLLEANKYGYHQDWMILTYQIAISKGHFIGIGSEGLETGGDPGDYPYSARSDLGRMFLGGIGTFGIISRVTVKLKYKPRRYEILYARSENLIELISKLRKVTQSTDAGQTALIADPKLLAGYLTKSKQNYLKFVNELSSWTGIVSIAGNDEWIEVEKADLFDAASKEGLLFTEDPPVSNISEILRDVFQTSDNVGKNFDFAPHLRIEFYTTTGNLEKLRGEMKKFFKSKRIPEEKIGFMTNSLEMGRTLFCEYDLFYEGAPEKINSTDLPNLGELNLYEAYEQSYKTLIEADAVINVPRNSITSQLIYPKVPNYYEMMRVLKYCLDPNNIMHPSIIFAGKGGIDPKTIQISQEASQ